jgi:Flp pilus assembly protein TadG
MGIRKSRSAVQGEQGATAVIVVLSLFALFGMIVLVVDVGGLLWARRGMVNASDAAALAAAQSCIGVTEDPEAFADQYATFNADSVFTTGSNITEQVNCHANRAGYVSVQYTREWPLFFGGVLGASPNGRVTTAATAHWGASGTANPIPLVIYVTALQGPCDVPNVDVGTTCYIWEANDFGVGGGNFGFLDVEEGWDVSKDGRCNNSGGANQVEEWISGPPVEAVSLNYPNATWVCTREMEGGNNPAWQALEDLVGEERDFPIVGPTPGDGEPWFIETPQSKYNVIGFAHFEIMDVRMASKLDSGEVSCSGINRAAQQPIDLMACVGAPEDATYDNDAAFGGNWGSTNPQIDADGMLTWTGTLPNGSKSVKFHYASLLSNCGGIPAPDGNASAHCLVLKWNGATIGQGSCVDCGADLGRYSVALCDVEIGSCVKPS